MAPETRDAGAAPQPCRFRCHWTFLRAFGRLAPPLIRWTTTVRFLPAPRVLALLFALMLAAPAWAFGPATYTGTAPVNSQSDAERTDALKTALASVVVEQTGDSSVLARPQVAEAVAQAERYVLQYQYRNNSADGAAKMTLEAQFDAAAVDRMLARLGLGDANAQQAAAAETPSEAVVWIGGIRNADDYARVIGYLARNNFVRGAQPTQARGDGILVKLSLATDLARFLDAAGMERTLVANTTLHVDGADAALALNP